MTRHLETPHHQKYHQVAEMERWSGWIKANIEGGRAAIELLKQRLAVGALRDQAAPFQVS
jgi:hypothetical protein